MSTHPEYNDLMVEALYGEISPDDRRRLEAHLEACDNCAEEFESLQATLDVMAQRERAGDGSTGRPRREGRSTRARDRTGERGSRRRTVLPQTGGQWAVQMGLALLMLAVGVLWGRSPAEPARVVESSPAVTTDLLLARESMTAEGGRVEPILRGVDDVAFDEGRGTVRVRYRTLNHVTLRGQPSDPAIQRLLRVALLDGSNPASQLHAMKVIERAAVSPTQDLVQPLTYLMRKEHDVGMRLRALSALHATYQGETMPADTRSVLVDLLLDTQTPASLRVEALQTLTSAPSSLDPDVLYPVRSDSNAYLRYRARAILQPAAVLSPTFDSVVP